MWPCRLLPCPASPARGPVGGVWWWECERLGGFGQITEHPWGQAWGNLSHPQGRRGEKQRTPVQGMDTLVYGLWTISGIVVKLHKKLEWNCLDQISLFIDLCYVIVCLQMWLKESEDVTWERFIEALTAIQLEELAKTVKEKFCCPPEAEEVTKPSEQNIKDKVVGTIWYNIASFTLHSFSV